ncbi:MAG: polysaccharide deacetylase family protein [Candidatus Limisoma sp.]|nr:polysaccharide deacetylase family protein [Muribaculaceae bacterium]MDD6868898.1 polysaccharide deacetylase family protein [bacterium]MDY5827743.1 polysaccharide deacetylase family protein [Candidatus Limisoma sp.]
MLIEQPPIPYRMLFPETVWRIPMTEKAVYLTFDDGPIPEVTPWVLDVLDHYGIKATFFCVGDNVRKHPATFQQVVERGHSVGNHTMHHLQGAFTTTKRYVADINEADSYIHSALFRPPHGLIRWKQAAAIKGNMRIIMYDLVTRDYSQKLTREEVLNNVKRYTRNGSIIVFHDSLKSQQRLRWALPRAIEWLKDNGYKFLPIPM